MERCREPSLESIVFLYLTRKRVCLFLFGYSNMIRMHKQCRIRSILVYRSSRLRRRRIDKTAHFSFSWTPGKFFFKNSPRHSGPVRTIIFQLTSGRRRTTTNAYAERRRTKAREPKTLILRRQLFSRTTRRRHGRVVLLTRYPRWVFFCFIFTIRPERREENWKKKKTITISREKLKKSPSPTDVLSNCFFFFAYPLKFIRPQ